MSSTDYLADIPTFFPLAFHQRKLLFFTIHQFPPTPEKNSIFSPSPPIFHALFSFFSLHLFFFLQKMFPFSFFHLIPKSFYQFFVVFFHKSNMLLMHFFHFIFFLTSEPREDTGPRHFFRWFRAFSIKCPPPQSAGRQSLCACHGNLPQHPSNSSRLQSGLHRNFSLWESLEWILFSKLWLPTSKYLKVAKIFGSPPQNGLFSIPPNVCPPRVTVLGSHGAWKMKKIGQKYPK